MFRALGKSYQRNSDVPAYGLSMRRMKDDDDIARLAHELDEAELFEQGLRSRIIAIRDALAAGHAAQALSLCNQTLNEIDNQADVVAPSRRTVAG